MDKSFIYEINGEDFEFTPENLDGFRETLSKQELIDLVAFEIDVPIPVEEAEAMTYEQLQANVLDDDLWKNYYDAIRDYYMDEAEEAKDNSDDYYSTMASLWGRREY
jgi:hypothetical protein